MSGFVFGDDPCRLSVSVDVDLVEDGVPPRALAA
jgi:hypothetical protein